MKQNRTKKLNQVMANKAIIQKIQQEIAGLKWDKTQFETASEQFREQLIWGQVAALREIRALQLTLQRYQLRLPRSQNWILNSGDCTPERELFIWACERLREKNPVLSENECAKILRFG